MNKVVKIYRSCIPDKELGAGLILETYIGEFDNIVYKIFVDSRIRLSFIVNHRIYLYINWKNINDLAEALNEKYVIQAM